MRLIDADIFKEYVMEGFRDNESLLKTEEYRDFARRIAESFCLDIDEQPTAYDVNKVVNQMEKDKFIDCETILSDVHQGYNAGLSRAIEIVKAGGRGNVNTESKS